MAEESNGTGAAQPAQNDIHSSVPQIQEEQNQPVQMHGRSAVPPASSSPAPQRQVGTPSRGGGAAAAAAGANSDPAAAAPAEPVEHGAPFRRYLNAKVTPVLLEGMKQLALDQPKDPLKFLGSYLLQRSAETEGT